MKRTVLLAAFFLASCALGQLDSLDVPADEAAIIGRIQIVFNGEDVTDSSALIRFDGDTVYTIPKDGWILTRLPTGAHYIDLIQFAKALQGAYHHSFLPPQTGFKLPDGGQIYYIGDIAVEWTGKNFKPSGLFGLAGMIVDRMSDDGAIKVVVNDNRAGAARQLTTRFNSRVDPKMALVGGSTAVR